MPKDSETDKPDSPKTESADELLRSDSLADYLGVQPNYAPDHLAPPVDRALLRRFVGNELSGPAREEVCQLVATFRSWEAACNELVRERK